MRRRPMFKNGARRPKIAHRVRTEIVTARNDDLFFEETTFSLVRGWHRKAVDSAQADVDVLRRRMLTSVTTRVLTETPCFPWPWIPMTRCFLCGDIHGLRALIDRRRVPPYVQLPLDAAARFFFSGWKFFCVVVGGGRRLLHSVSRCAAHHVQKRLIVSARKSWQREMTTWLQKFVYTF